MAQSLGVAVQADDFSYRHAARKNPALKNVSFEVAPGEILLVLGESGAGKSTLFQVLAGVAGDADEGDATGTITVAGIPCTNPAELRGKVGLVLQDPDSQTMAHRVGDDLAFGLENLGLPRDEIWRRVEEALALVQLDVPLDWPTSHLSGGEKQRLAIAGVVAMRPGLLLLDEPTANIDPAASEAIVAAVVAACRTYGMTCMVIEHNVELWAEYADRVMVIGSETGEPHSATVLAMGTTARVLQHHEHSLLEMGVWLPGSELQLPSLKAPKRTPLRLPEALPPGVSGKSPAVKSRETGPANSLERILQTQHLPPADTQLLNFQQGSLGWQYRDERGNKQWHEVLSELSCAVTAGYSYVIRGENGTGKSTLALTLAGLLQPEKGEVHAPGLAKLGPGLPEVNNDLPAQWTSPQLAARIGMVFQQPEYQFVAPTVLEELLVAPQNQLLAGKPWYRRRRAQLNQEIDDLVKDRVEHILHVLRLDHLANANPFTLSGGQKRRLSVATALVLAPPVVVLDEPTFGQDRRTFKELVVLLQQLAAHGTTLISITHSELYTQAMGQKVWQLRPGLKGQNFS